MAGLLAALALAERVLLVACDLPALEPWLLHRLIGLARGHPVAIPLLGDRLEPLCAVYGAEAVPTARASLAIGSGRMSDLLRVPGALTIPGRALGPADHLPRQFRNVNDPSHIEL
jgi:molybdopterin-guanine dinucleotide biosynthesis protein A